MILKGWPRSSATARLSSDTASAPAASGVPPDDWPHVEAALAAHFDGRTPEYETEHRVRARSGEWRWVLDRAKLFSRDEAGRPLRMVGTELDITRRKELEDELRRSEARSSGILSISADAIDLDR